MYTLMYSYVQSNHNTDLKVKVFLYTVYLAVLSSAVQRMSFAFWKSKI